MSDHKRAQAHAEEFLSPYGGPWRYATADDGPQHGNLARCYLALHARVTELEKERDEAHLGLITSIKDGEIPQWLMYGAKGDFETEAAGDGKGENDV